MKQRTKIKAVSMRTNSPAVYCKSLLKVHDVGILHGISLFPFTYLIENHSINSNSPYEGRQWLAITPCWAR